MSSPAQAKRRGQQRQEEIEVSAYIREIGARLVDTWTVGERASIFDRPRFVAELRRAIAWKTQGLIDGVVLPSVDRLSRDPYDGGAICREALLAGLRLLFAAERLDVSRLQDQDRIVGALQAARAYVERLKRQTTPARRARAGEEMIPNGQVRWPFRYVGDRNACHYGKAFPIRERAAVVRRWMETLLNGGVLADIQRELQTDGIVSPKGAPMWSRSTITRILRDPALKGEFYCGWERMEADAFHEAAKRRKSSPTLVYTDKPNAILSDEEWQAVQERLDRNKELAVRNTRYDYGPLHLRVRCGICDRAMSAAGGRKGPAIRCPMCRRWVNAGKLWNDTVKPELRALLKDPSLVERHIPLQMADTLSSQVLLEEIKERQEQLQRVGEMEMRALRMGISLPGYLERRLNAELAKLARERERLQAEILDRQRRMDALAGVTIEDVMTAVMMLTMTWHLQWDRADVDWYTVVRGLDVRVELHATSVQLRLQIPLGDQLERIDRDVVLQQP